MASLAGAVCSGGSRGYGPSKLAPKRQRGLGMLTEGQNGWCGRAGRSATTSSGGSRWRSRTWVMQSSSGLRFSTGRCAIEL